MSRYVVALVVCCACGRIGFDRDRDGGTGGNGGDGDRAVPSDAERLDDGAGANDVLVQLSPTGRCAAVAWSGTRIGAAWSDGSDDAAVVRFAELDPSGAIVEGPVDVRLTTFLDCPAITWVGDGYLVSYAHGDATRHRVDVNRVTAGMVGPTITLVSDAGDSVAVALATTNATTLAAWRTVQGASQHVFLRPLAATGETMGVVTRASGLVADNAAPHVASTPTGFAVTWAGGGTVRLRMYDAAGAAATAEVATSNAAAGRVPAAWLGGELLAAWSAFASDAFATGRFTASGMAVAAPIMMSEQAPDAMALAPMDGGAALLFSETSGVVQFHLARLSASGQRDGQDVMNSASTTSRASLVRAGTNLVAGMDSSNGAFVRVIVP